MSSNPDVIIIGLGGMGTATAWRLAQRGLRVLGLEQHRLNHDLGSSHGHTRITRQAYYEHPAYVPLVRRSNVGWHELEVATGEHLLTACPCLTLGPPSGELVTGVRRSAQQHALPVEELSLSEVSRRHPAFHFPAACDMVGIVEHTAGFLYVDRCVRTLADAAQNLGATLRESEVVVSWRAVAGGVEVESTAGRYFTNKLVITAGPWAGNLLGKHGTTLRVMRQVAFWLRTSDDALFRRDQFPVFIADTPEGYFYGIPMLDGRGVKVARHYGAEEQPGVEAVARHVTADDEAPIRAFARQYLPMANGPVGASSVCVYTLTPDRHFVIDRIPETDGVALAAGFSGHGFKFAPVVGEILADLVIDGHTNWPIDLFRLQR